MSVLGLTLTSWLTFANMALSSVLVILAFSLLAYTLTYNFGSTVARWFAFLLGCIALSYASDVALARVTSAPSAERWLRLQWLGIALLPAANYRFSLAVLRATNHRVGRRRGLGMLILGIAGVSAVLALFSTSIVDLVRFQPPISYLEPGPLFWVFSLFYAATSLLALDNIWKARGRCLTDSTRQRMTYLFVAFAVPSIGIFPYLIGADRLLQSLGSSAAILTLALLVNGVVAFALIVMSYSVAYFGVLTPDRVVRYRLLRFFIRGPVVAILVILAVQTVPKVETLLGLPRDVILFSVITGVIVLSQLLLSVTKTLVDRLVYREDREEIAWLRELDRRLLATSDLRQFLENNLASLCELLRVPSGFVAVTSGPDLMLEVVVGPPQVREQVVAVDDWTAALGMALRRDTVVEPLSHRGFWIWPLLDSTVKLSSAPDDAMHVLGILGVEARTETPLLSADEVELLDHMIENSTRALMDQRLQQDVFVALQAIIPDIERIQQMRNVAPYQAAESEASATEALLSPSPIHSPEFEAWVRDALRHYLGRPQADAQPAGAFARGGRRAG